MNKYCVYIHTNPVKQEVFYVGIGNEKRPFDISTRTTYWKNIVNKYGYLITIIHRDLTREQAIKKEINYIKLFGRRDMGLGSLVNMTNGGDGVSGWKSTEESRKNLSRATSGRKFSEKHKMLISQARKNYWNNNPIQKEKMSARKKGNTNVLGKKLSKETIEKQSKARYKVLTPEFREKLSEAIKKSWIKRRLHGRR